MLPFEKRYPSTVYAVTMSSLLGLSSRLPELAAIRKNRKLTHLKALRRPSKEWNQKKALSKSNSPSRATKESGRWRVSRKR